MKWILVLIVFPGNIMPGKETHVPFPSAELCEKALRGVNLPNWDHVKYCVPEGSDEWYYKREKK